MSFGRTNWRIVSAPPRVFVVGITTPCESGLIDYLHHREATWNHDGIGSDPEALVEAAGRVCYRSWENHKRSSRRDYLQRSIIDHGHGSVLEHVWVNLLVADLPRSVQLELVRHGEGTAFSFESQRFTDRDLRFVAPPAIRNETALMALFQTDCAHAWRSYSDLLRQLDALPHILDIAEATLRRKRTREAARAMLPNCVAGDGMVSINARAVRHILQLRSDAHADASIREFVFALYEAILPWLPTVLGDADLKPVQNGPDAIVFSRPKV